MTITDSDPSVFVGVDTTPTSTTSPWSTARPSPRRPRLPHQPEGLRGAGGLVRRVRRHHRGRRRGHAYGAALTRHLRTAGLNVVEVDRPDRRSRRLHGKTDTLDAYSAARVVAAGRATAIPKAKNGLVESIRCLHVARRSAVKARTQAINQIRGLLVSGPASLREQTRGLGTKALISAVARPRPAADATDPTVAVKIAVRGLARRCQDLNEEIAVLDTHLASLTAQAAPELLARPELGVDTVAQLLITVGDNPDRLRSEAAFARLTGTAPIPASSGRTDRHRLSRGGDRQANRALHTIVLVRMHRDEQTRSYVQRRTEQGLGKKDIIRCLKRALAREVYHHLRPMTALAQKTQPV